MELEHAVRTTSGVP